MRREDAIELLKENFNDYVDRELEPSKGKNKYVCPFCRSGTGPNGTGAFEVYPDENRFYCHVCHRQGDIFDLIGVIENISDYNEKIKRAGQIYGVTIDPDNGSQSQGGTKAGQKQDKNERKTAPAKKKKKPEEPPTDYTDFFLQANKDLAKTDYHRGISMETLNRFKVGYVENWRHPKAPQTVPTSPRLIVPTSKYSYIARATGPISDEAYKKQKEGSLHILNIEALKTAKAPIFVVEGEIDALSVIDVGGEAVGLGCTGMVKHFLEEIDKTPPRQPLIIALDNDIYGQNAGNELLEGLKERNIKAYERNITGKYKDANEALNANREEFKATIENQTKIIRMIANTDKREKIIKKAACTAIPDFIKHIKDSTKASYYSTGFTDLDALLDGGLYAGLYIIGAISSLGKTTFCLQIADQIAQQGHDVLIFSLEMAKDELIAKSISRLTALEDMKQLGTKADAKTTRGILTGSRYKNYTPTEKALISNALRDYEEYAGHIYISAGIGDIGIADIQKDVQDYMDVTGHAPIVLIDYLQILKPADIRATDKQNTDIAVVNLKCLSSTFNIPVIGISSFNRENYNAPVNLTSFKESGAIEYSSDVLIGLQYSGMDYQEGEKEPNRLKRLRTLTTDMINRAKNGEAQDIQVKVLKNRNGSKGDTVIKFYPKFNLFQEKDETEKALDEWEDAKSSY